MSVSNFGDEDTIDADENSAVDMEEVEKYRKQRENKKWPDEVDTPNDVSARERFQKYRGLKSFRTSPWDSKENLPSEYGKISKFSNFKRTKKIVLNEIEKSFEKNENGEINVVLPGSFVTLHISCVPVAMQEKLQRENPLVVFSLLAHEEKMTVMNLLLHKHLSCLVPVNNKDNLIFQVGYRRFEAQPLFSEHNNGSKFKMHRFMPSEGTFCASVYAPVMFPPASVLVFRRDKKGRQRLVATGNVLDLNPDRIVLKRVVLSGHPYRVNKRLAVVRYMFFSKDDVHWFKPVEVYTPKGRRGHIKEPLGIHGLFKCVFDQPLNTQDSVLMNLYKRVFPKWTYNSRVNEFSIEGNRSRSDTVSTDVKMEE
ncbi:pre-rRNA-processing protein TSR1 like protein [Ditylenchus destructor]|nr:pre-rRNA-processing protein TSR1 like protein [Ditylenchus destructor]